MIEVKDTEFEGLKIIEPRVFADNRGYFCETYNLREFDEKVGTVRFVQDNESRSSRGVIRGLHYQRGEHAQAKLVRCTEGCIIDIVLDIRPESATYGKHFCIELSAENHRQLFIPKGFAHGFVVLSEVATFQYKCDALYAPASEAGISILSPGLDIDIPVPAELRIFSEKDLRWPEWPDIML